MTALTNILQEPVTHATPARFDPHGAAMETALQMTPAVDRLRETLTGIRHFLAGGDGSNVEPLTPEDAAYVSAIATRAAAYAHPSSQRDVEAGALGTLQAITRIAIRELLRDETHSDKKLIQAAYERLAAKLASDQTIRHLLSSVGAILDQRVTLAVRHPHAIDTDGVIMPLAQDRDGFFWPDCPPHCVGGSAREFCGEPLTIDGDPDARPNLKHDATGTVVVCQFCHSEYEIAERIALVGVRR